MNDSGMDEEEREEGDVFIEPKRVLPVLIKQGKGNSSLHYHVIWDECCLEGFFGLGPVLVSISNAFVFKLGEPSLSKGFSSFLGHPIEENHGSHFIRKLVHMKDKVGLCGHEPSIGIFSFFTEFFRKGSFDVYYVIILIFV